MKTFTFQIELTDDEVANAYEYYVAQGNIAPNQEDQTMALHAFIKAHLEHFYYEQAQNILKFKAEQVLQATEVTPKDVEGTVV